MSLFFSTSAWLRSAEAMFSNPFAGPLFVATLWRLALAFFLLFIWALWRRWRSAGKDSDSAPLAKMIATAWAAPVLLIALFTGVLALLAAIALIMLQGLCEYVRLVSLDRAYGVVLIAFSLTGVALVAICPRFTTLLSLPMGVFLLATLVPITSGRVADSYRQVSITTTGYLYISAPLSFIIFTRAAEPWGLRFLIIVGAATALADAGGLMFGSWLKGPKLAPKVSPCKTWSGVLGSLAASIIGVCLFWPIAPKSWSLGTLMLLVLAVTIGAVWGDLIESSIKRDSGVKDTGTILSGSGGVLDRFDSVFLAFPVAYISVLLVHSLQRVCDSLTMVFRTDAQWRNFQENGQELLPQGSLRARLPGMIRGVFGDQRAASGLY